MLCILNVASFPLAFTFFSIYSEDHFEAYVNSDVGEMARSVFSH